MNSRSKSRKVQLSREEIDEAVESLADDNSAWEKPVQVRRAREASLSLPAELAARAAFLTKLHREKTVQDWLRRIIKERVELEELAFVEAKREISLRNGL